MLVIFPPLEQVPDGSLERVSDPLDIDETDVSSPPLDAADVGSIEPRVIRKFLLRVSKRGTRLSNALSECALNVIIAWAAEHS